MGLRDRIRASLTTALLAPTPSPALAEPIEPTVIAPSESRADAFRAMFRPAAQRLDSVINTVTSLGTGSDKSQASRPDTSRVPLTDTELEVLYAYNGYAKRLVNYLPWQATRKGWRVVDDTDEAEPLADEHTDLAVFETFRQADVWARLYRSSLIVLVTEEMEPPPEEDAAEGMRFRQAAQGRDARNRAILAEPLDTDRLVKITRLVVLTRPEFEIESWDDDLASPTFRQPLSYRLTPVVRRGFGWTRNTLVHASRCLFFIGDDLPANTSAGTYSEEPAASVLQAWWDSIRGKTSSDNAGEILVHEAKQDVMKVAGLADMQASEQRELLQMRMQLIALQKSIANMVVVGTDEDFVTRAQSLTGWADLDDRQAIRLAAVTGLPLSKLFGQAPAGLSTDDASGQRTLDETVSGHQSMRYREHATRVMTLLYLQSDGPTNGVIPDGARVIFNALQEPSKAEKATTEKVVAEGDAIRIASGVLTSDEVRQSRYGGSELGEEILPVDAEIEDTAADDLDAEIETAAQESSEETADIETADGAKKLADTALNGSQAQSGREVVIDVVAGKLPRDSGVAMLQAFYALSPETAEAVMGSAGLGFVPSTPDTDTVPPPPPQPNGNNPEPDPEEPEEAEAATDDG